MLHLTFQESLATKLQKLGLFTKFVSNPLMVMLEKAQVQRSPYTLRMKDGLYVEIRPNTGDVFGFYEVLLRRNYFASGQVLRQGDTVVDVGANIGCFSLFAARAIGPSGMVIAVEPEESTFCQLLRNIEINNLKNIIPVKAAVGARSQNVTLHVSKCKLNASLYDRVNEKGIEGEEQSVRVTTLEELFKEKHIVTCDYLKIDCEGSEYDIIDTMSFELARRVQQITIELHHIPGADPTRLHEQLVELGFARIAGSGLPYYRSLPM